MKKTTDMHIRDFIRPAHMIKKETTVEAALKLMHEKGMEFLSVVDDGQRLIGCVNDISFMKFVKQKTSTMSDTVWYDTIDPAVASTTVEKIMTTNISTVSAADTVSTAFKVMDSVGYKLLHVVDGKGVLVGVVTIKDIFHRILGA